MLEYRRFQYQQYSLSQSEPDISISINLLKMDSMSNYILKSFGKIKKYVSKLILQKNIIKYYIIL